MNLIILVILIIIGIIFTFVLKSIAGSGYKGEKEYLTPDVIDDDIDDHYQENDWDDTLWNINDFEDNNFIYEMDDEIFNI